MDANSMIKEMTAILLTLGASALGLVGGYLASVANATRLKARKPLVFSMVAFAISCGCGLLIYMRVIVVLLDGEPLAGDLAIGGLSSFQIIFAGVAGILFMYFLCTNLWERHNAP